MILRLNIMTECLLNPNKASLGNILATDKVSHYPK